MNRSFLEQLKFIPIKVYRKLFFPIVKWKTVITKRVVLEPGAYYDRKTWFEGDARLGMTAFLDRCRIGKGSYVAAGSYLILTDVGRYSSIGANVTTAIGNHPIRGRISSSPSLYSSQPSNGLSLCVDPNFSELIYSNEEEQRCVTIGNDVWIGTGTTILSGVTIHDGAVVGAGSLVTKDVEPYGIYVGCPAKKIGSRFTDEEIEALLAVKWWEKDEEWIRVHAYECADVRKFVASYKNNLL